MPDFVRSHGPKVAIGGLVLINAALVTALVVRQPAQTAVPAGQTSSTPVTATSSSATPRTSASPAAGSARTSTSGASPSAGSSPSNGTGTGDGSSTGSEAQASTPVASRLLAIGSEQVAWRATTGSCDDPSTLEVTRNGGRSWQPVDTSLKSIVRLKTYGTDAVFVVGGDADCRAAFVRVPGPTENSRRDDDQLPSTWYRVPARMNLVHAPGGRTSAPCGSKLADLAGLGTYRAAALCTDGRVRTIDDGRTWRTVRTDPGVLSVNADDSTFVAAARRTGCDGLVVQRFDAGGDGLASDAGRCTKGADEAPTQVAVRGETTALWRGDTLTVN